MDIFSKREGPRREDVRAKRLISENAGTISRLADTISNGGFTRMRQEQARRKEEPKPEGLLIYSMAGPAKPDEPDPHVRVSLNGRVVLADRRSGKQLQLLGEIRSRSLSRYLVLATNENGFISPISDEIQALLGDYENAELSSEFNEKQIVQKFEESLGIAAARQPQDHASDGRTEKGHGTPEDDSSELL